MLSIRIGKSIYVIFTPREQRNLVILQIGLSACFLIGVSLFYYLKSSVKNSKTIPALWKFHIMALFLVVFITGIFKPYQTSVAFWNTFFVNFIYAIWGLYLFASGFVLKNIFKSVFDKAEKCTTAELWLLYVFVANVLVYAAYIIGYFYLYYIGTLTFSFVLYALFFFLIFKKNRITIFQDIPKKYNAKKIENKEAIFILQELEELMEVKGLYKKADIKLADVSNELNISTHRLSQLLNDNLGKSFAMFINEYRVDEAKRLLKDNNQYTLEAIGYEAGFNSKSTFYATFKKITNCTPAQFKNRLKL